VPAYNSGFVLFAPSTFVVNLKLCARGKQTQSRKTLYASTTFRFQFNFCGSKKENKNLPTLLID